MSTTLTPSSRNIWGFRIFYFLSIFICLDIPHYSGRPARKKEFETTARACPMNPLTVIRIARSLHRRKVLLSQQRSIFGGNKVPGLGLKMKCSKPIKIRLENNRKTVGTGPRKNSKTSTIEARSELKQSINNTSHVY